jgi:hypothetical protein
MTRTWEALHVGSIFLHATSPLSIKKPSVIKKLKNWARDFCQSWSNDKGYYRIVPSDSEYFISILLTDTYSLQKKLFPQFTF